jgi:hypothetical protein
MSDPAAFAAICTIIAALIFLAFLFGFYRLFRRALRLLLKAINFSDLPPLAILLALAISAALFRVGANSVWALIYGLLELLFVNFPRALVDVAYSSYSCSRATYDASCLFQSAAQFANSLKAILNQPFSEYSVRVVPLVQFFASWALLAWLLGHLIGLLDKGEAAPGARGLASAYNAITAPVRARIGLGMIILVATYLCLCAIMAVSLFKPPSEKPQQLTDTQLEAQLTKAKLSNSESSKAFDDRFPIDHQKLPETSKAGVDRVLAGANDQLTESWQKLRSQAIAEQDRLLQRAIASYTIENLNRVGSREQADHFLAVSRWYQSALTNVFDRLDRCRGAILQIRSVANVAVVEASSVPTPDASAQQPARPAEPSQDPIAPASNVLPPGTSGGSIFASSNAGALLAVANQECSRHLDVGDPPDRSDFGYTLGIAGDLSSWLLRSESMPLALITGLVGFGLLGALVSRSVRAPTDDTATLDFFGIVSRGVSAAVVVFLAAYGGLTIFSQTTPDPNPFVVFLTCLVGAVFGDDVWSWAKQWIKERGGSSGGGKQASPAQ